MKRDSGDWSDYKRRPSARRGCFLVLVAIALAWIAGFACGVLFIEQLYFNSRP